ncbi:hypothetical protein RHMOL_Rhmol05G0146100 [Rhododendron molle]|uniref:Uncharacterized protein n=1 Tax=Rhododendron molle TaxID=49168 RepID=A0ACC0NR98_RHOML|nr:hypothetical protein RHMOL_Rhmol05G0146100 [Rhododendron molle]
MTQCLIHGHINAATVLLFDEFLMDMKQNKRRSIRQDRKKISAQNLTMKRLRGDEITFLLIPLDSAYTFGVGFPFLYGSLLTEI